jgi:hypothetical protein
MRIVKTVVQAEQEAGEFFKEAFNHSGIVGIDKQASTRGECGETLAIEFYSKDDPGMADTYWLGVCEQCGEE